LENIIDFEAITKRFPGVVALDKVSFSIANGEIHAIVGENGAGKSTLMNILGGQIQPDGGEVIFKEKSVRIPNPHASISMGISIVYQEFKLCPNLSVVENIYLGREKEGGRGRVNWRRMAAASREVLESLGADINPRTRVGNLSIAQQQIVEIAKAMSLNVDVLIMDEPTSALTLTETENLFTNLRRLKEQGVTVIFISHRLDEVFKITDRISVLRDGKYLGTNETREVDIDQVVTLIAGRELSSELSHEHKKEEDEAGRRIALDVKGLSRGRYFSHVTFQLYEKEILGIYGLQGAGRTELLETLFGIERADKGEVIVFGKKVEIRRPSDAIGSGFAMVPEDRRKTGLFSNLDVKDNISVANIKENSQFGFVNRRKILEIAREFVGKIEIKVRSINQMVKNLSGGNQQKVIVSRWLATNPKVFLVDELTRGIDVGAKAEIYKILRGLRDDGLSILLVSSELPEILAECDRVLVMRNGKLVADFPIEEVSKEKVIRFALKG
jgi:ribose transport system ATP-binding protein